MLVKFFLGIILCLAIYWFNNFNKQDGDIVTYDTSVLRPPDVEIPQPPSRSLLHVFKTAAVCSDKNICSSIGSAILLNKGNAIDAAISTLLCNGLVTMQSMGIGGGIIMTFYHRTKGTAFSIIGRERTPLNINIEEIKRLHNATSYAKSALSIAVPGELMAYHEAHRHYGSLPWSHLIQPTLKLCHTGYKLTRHQYDALYLNEEMIRKNRLLRQMFIDPTTNLFHKEGRHIQFPTQVCSTYELLAKEGPLTFYNGSLASLVINDLKAIGSPITLEDLHTFKADVKESFKLDMEPYNIYLPQPPGSGHVIGFILKLLHYFKNDFSLAKRFETLEVHRIVEALKLGFVKRWQCDADMDNETLKSIFETESIENVTLLIDDLKTFSNPQYYGSDSNLIATADYGTAHISVLAPNGDAVSATSSINYYFGSGRMGSRSGILFNNAMSDFTIENFENYFNLPNIKSINEIKAQKQPMSSMAPIIVAEKSTGDVRLVVGAAGGSRIISTLVQILVRVLWQHQNIKEAIDSPRFHHQLIPNILEYEFGMLQQVVQDLQERGHITRRVRRKSTAVCGIERADEGVVFANADYRKEGGVEGF